MDKETAIADYTKAHGSPRIFGNTVREVADMMERYGIPYCPECHNWHFCDTPHIDE